MCPNTHFSFWIFPVFGPKHTLLEIHFRFVKYKAVTKIQKNFEHLFIPMQAMQAITVCLPLQKVVKRIIRDKQLWKNIPVSLSG